MRDIVVSAIKNLKRLQIWYDPGLRIIEPHCFGGGSSGQLLLRAFQIDGASASGEHTHWKLFRLDRMGPMELGECFPGPRPDYNPEDRVMKRGIICAL